MKVSTSKTKGASPVTTELSIDWTGCSAEHLKMFAIQALVIKRQGVWRRGGIPAKESIRAIDHLPGTRNRVEQKSEEEILAELYARMGSMTPAQRAAYIGGMPLAEAFELEEVEAEGEIPEDADTDV